MAEPSLEALQQWLQTVVATPGALPHRLEQARSFLPPSDAAIVVSDDRATALERLRVYTSGYAARMQECLEADYPALKRWLGAPVFEAFCQAYLQRHPSRSFTLSDLGAQFPDFLAPPAARLQQARTAEEGVWLHLPTALASLERSIQEALRAPGDEAAAPIDSSDLYDLFSGAVCVSRPSCLQLLATPFPVWDFYQRLLRDEQPVPPPPDLTYLAVSRKAYRLTTAPLTEPQYRCLRVLGKTPLPLHTVLEKAALPAADAAPLLADLLAWLPVWQQEGFVSLHPF